MGHNDPSTQDPDIDAQCRRLGFIRITLDVPADPAQPTTLYATRAKTRGGGTYRYQAASILAALRAVLFPHLANRGTRGGAK